jgi:hypothetical protein
MPFERFNAMSLKEGFVRLAEVEGANVSELCRRFNFPHGLGRGDPDHAHGAER